MQSVLLVTREMAQQVKCLLSWCKDLSSDLYKKLDLVGHMPMTP